MSKCEFNKLHFGMGAFLYIKFVACIFSGHLWMAASDTGYLAHFLVAFEMESICISVETK